MHLYILQTARLISSFQDTIAVPIAINQCNVPFLFAEAKKILSNGKRVVNLNNSLWLNPDLEITPEVIVSFTQCDTRARHKQHDAPFQLTLVAHCENETAIKRISSGYFQVFPCAKLNHDESLILNQNT